MAKRPTPPRRRVPVAPLPAPVAPPPVAPRPALRPPAPRRTSLIDLVGGSVALQRPRELAKEPVQPTTPATEDTPAEIDRKKQLHTDAIDRFRICVDAYSKQRTRELEDLSFELDSWPAAYRKERAGGIGSDGHVTPERPCLEINKLDVPIQQVINEARMARLAIQIKPGNGGTKEQAYVRQGLIRAIEVDSRAQMARLWALDRAVKCGRGAYRIQKKYANDGDAELDLVVERILNQHSVYFDPFAKEPDWSDGEWAFLTADIPEGEYKRRWPKSALSLASSEQLTAIGDAAPGWITTSDKGKVYRVAEHYYVVHENRKRVYLDGIGWTWFDELVAGQQAKITRERIVDLRHVKWCVMNGYEILDEEDWEGRYIPVIPVIGKEYNVDGERVWKGMISNAKDAQRSYNVMRSRQLEAIGLASLSTWVMAEGQDEGLEQQWDNANTSSYTRLYYRPTTFEGHLVPPPIRDVAEPAIAAITQAVREADNDIKATTGRFDPSLGRQSSDRSGRAIRELKVQGETGTSNYLDSLASLSMVYEGKVLNDMLEYVYDAEGRIARIIGDEDDEADVMLNAPYQEVGPDKTPTPLREGDVFDPNNKRHKHYDLKDGWRYRVVVTVGPSAPTQQEADKQFMSELAQAWPAGVPIFADLWVRASGSKAADQIAERIKRTNPYAKTDHEDGGQSGDQIPAEVQAQMQQLQQQYQAAVQQVQQLQQQIQMEQAKLASQQQTKAAEITSRERIEILKIRADLLIERAKLDAQRGLAEVEAELERMNAEADRAHEATTMLLGQKHDERMARQDHLLGRALAPAPEPTATE